MRNTREKLDLLLEYQNVPEEKKGEWLSQKGLHTEHLTLFRQELERKNDALAEMAAIYT